MPEKQAAGDKATKKILQNVVFPDRTYGPGDEDELEKRLTPGRCQQLLEQDPPALEGEWDATGDGGEPMANSRDALGGVRRAFAGMVSRTADKPHPAVAENESLREKVKKLEAELASHQKAAEREAEVSRRAAAPAPAEGDGGQQEARQVTGRHGRRGEG